jgi:adenylate isopentenyltransferase (cytokinin synthase)
MTSLSGNVIAVFGPTGVGKTRLGVSLSKYLGGEVISVDSLQCYKAGAIMTAQPQPLEMGEIPHHLIAYLEADEEPHCDYVAEAMRKIHDVNRRGRLPILVGGSISLGAPLLSEIRDQNFRVLVITLIPDLQDGQYSSAIGVRIEQMVEMGLLDEVHELRMLKANSPAYSNSKGVWKAVGYPELEAYDECPADDPYRSLQLHTGLSLMKANTLRYALTQLQWLKRELIPMAQMYGMECLSLSVNVGAQMWDAEVEKPAVCASSKFCSDDAAISFNDLCRQRVVCLL